MEEEVIDFDNPPLKEVALGLSFNIDEYNFTIESDFYNKVKDTFPSITENNPIIMQEEIQEINEGRRQMPVRYYFINKTDDMLLQLQRGKFFFNWKKDLKTYPHYEEMLKYFNKYFDLLKKVFYSKNINIEPKKLHITYVNHIYTKDFNNKKIFEFYFDENSDLLNQRTILSFKQCNGLINININTAKKDNEKFYVLELTISCPLNKESDINSLFNKAHKKIIELFINITTKETKSIWGLK